MGMYDEVKIEMPLPDSCPNWARHPNMAFQTKDMDCELKLYSIDKYGYLIDTDGRTPVYYHGDMNAYENEPIESSRGRAFPPRGWVDLIIRFDDGRAKWIKTVDEFSVYRSSVMAELRSSEMQRF